MNRRERLQGCRKGHLQQPRQSVAPWRCPGCSTTIEKREAGPSRPAVRVQGRDMRFKGVTSSVDRQRELPESEIADADMAKPRRRGARRRNPRSSRHVLGVPPPDLYRRKAGREERGNRRLESRLGQQERGNHAAHSGRPRRRPRRR